jgi:hypothetical protein
MNEGHLCETRLAQRLIRLGCQPTKELVSRGPMVAQSPHVALDAVRVFNCQGGSGDFDVSGVTTVVRIIDDLV